MLKLQGAIGVVAGSLCLVWIALHSKHEMLIIFAKPEDSALRQGEPEPYFVPCT